MRSQTELGVLEQICDHSHLKAWIFRHWIRIVYATVRYNATILLLSENDVSERNNWGNYYIYTQWTHLINHADDAIILKESNVQLLSMIMILLGHSESTNISCLQVIKVAIYNYEPIILITETNVCKKCEHIFQQTATSWPTIYLKFDQWICKTISWFYYLISCHIYIPSCTGVSVLTRVSNLHKA